MEMKQLQQWSLLVRKVPKRQSRRLSGKVVLKDEPHLRLLVLGQQIDGQRGRLVELELEVIMGVMMVSWF